MVYQAPNSSSASALQVFCFHERLRTSQLQITTCVEKIPMNVRDDYQTAPRTKNVVLIIGPIQRDGSVVPGMPFNRLPNHTLLINNTTHTSQLVQSDRHPANVPLMAKAVWDHLTNTLRFSSFLHSPSWPSRTPASSTSSWSSSHVHGRCFWGCPSLDYFW